MTLDPRLLRRPTPGQLLEPNDLVLPAAGVVMGGDYGLGAAYITNDGSELVYSMDFFKTTALAVGVMVLLGTFVEGYRISKPEGTNAWAYTLGDVRVGAEIVVGVYTTGQGVAPNSWDLFFIPFTAHAEGDCDFECYSLRVPLVTGVE